MNGILKWIYFEIEKNAKEAIIMRCKDNKIMKKKVIC